MKNWTKMILAFMWVVAALSVLTAIQQFQINNLRSEVRDLKRLHSSQDLFNESVTDYLKEITPIIKDKSSE